MRQRIASLDGIRGIAVLGILLLNIGGFGLPKIAYLNPAYAGIPSLNDTLTWSFLAIFAQGKFLAMFALLFGAGLELLLPKGKEWIRSRLSWLLVLGVIHFIFFWDGDILLYYGLIGLVCWRLLRDTASARDLMKTGLIMYSIGLGVLLLLGFIDSGSNTYWQPSAEDLLYESQWKLTGGMLAIHERLSNLALALLGIIIQYGWQLAGMMVFGAGLMRSGWLKGQYSVSHYRKCAWVFIAIGLFIQTFGVLTQVWLKWDAHWCIYYLQLPRELSAPVTALGYMALWFGYWPTLSQYKFADWMRAVGSMSLTSYLLQTLICCLIFYWLEGYQTFSRLQMLAMVPGIWLCIICFALNWQRYFKQGPIEWVWRKLTAFSVRPKRVE